MLAPRVLRRMKLPCSQRLGILYHGLFPEVLFSKERTLRPFSSCLLHSDRLEGLFTRRKNLNSTHYGFCTESELQYRITPTVRKSLQHYITRHEELSKALNEATRPDVIRKVSIELNEISFVVDNVQAFDRTNQEISDLEKVISEETDQDMLAMEKEDLHQKTLSLIPIEKNLLKALVPKDPADSRNAIIEIRAGAGGNEASLFASEMFRMYQFYANFKDWQFDALTFNTNDVGGCKEASALIEGHGVFGQLKWESGVHRVQRVPETETQGRIHTSTITVAILPEAEDVDIKILDKDLRVDTYRSSGPGGQHVNKTESAIRITHLPTGTVVSIQDERSQHRNRDRAMKILRSKLFELERDKLAKERASNRSSQVGSGERNERIRTYNFPQDRITDHRCNSTKFDVEKMMRGEILDEFSAEMSQLHYEESLKNLQL
eukprot:TRINITY_DN7951_c0_g1_i1.p1 TRINITY_DN7951_c0_g1~~TRINITY_DN7951_c0_g1_i1.p1  ORF type:complete len:435 (+),score=87.31 TRINITY_DN7951_c0_g1_i1:102-1406(+)